LEGGSTVTAKPAFLGSLSAASCVTLFGVALSLASIAFVAEGRFEAMALCVIWAGICDFLDGPVSRKFPIRDPFRARMGAFLDSVADMASFGIAPVCVAWLWGNRTPLDALIHIAYVFCAAQRLSHFAAQEEKAHGERRTHYCGLPVTFASLFLSLAYLLLPFAGAAVLSWTLRGLFASLALLYVVNVPVPKPRGPFYPIFILTALGLTAFWIARLAA
jgi:CDP-diacylglycerol--serine O-phosphatidyltransferase